MMKVRPAINVTPLIDVLLVLLIIFMAISPLKPCRFAAQIPQAASPGAAAHLAPIVVSVTASGGLRLNSRELGAEELSRELNRLLGARAAEDRAVLISGAPSLAYRAIVEVIDLVKGAGAERQGLLLEAAN
jgi:biopolymer transport protein ExbD